jgi:hypothetical protein
MRLRGFAARITIAPVITATGKLPNALALALDDQAIATMLYLVKPIRPGRNSGFSIVQQCPFSPTQRRVNGIGPASAVSRVGREQFLSEPVKRARDQDRV